MDLDTQLISLYVIGFIGLLGVAVTVYDVCTGNGTLLSHLIGAAAASVPLFLLVILSGERAMGRGDAELMLAGGLFLGVKGVVVGLFLGLILGCIFGMITRQNRRFQICLWAVPLRRHGNGSGGRRTHCKSVLTALRSEMTART